MVPCTTDTASRMMKPGSSRKLNVNVVWGDKPTAEKTNDCAPAGGFDSKVKVVGPKDAANELGEVPSNLVQKLIV